MVAPGPATLMASEPLRPYRHSPAVRFGGSPRSSRRSRAHSGEHVRGAGIGFGHMEQSGGRGASMRSSDRGRNVGSTSSRYIYNMGVLRLSLSPPHPLFLTSPHRVRVSELAVRQTQEESMMTRTSWTVARSSRRRNVLPCSSWRALVNRCRNQALT